MAQKLGPRKTGWNEIRRRKHLGLDLETGKPVEKVKKEFPKEKKEKPKKKSKK